MSTAGLHQMKKMEIVLRGDRLAYLEEEIDQAGITGYTIVRDISGKGHGGFHGGRLIYNEKDSYVMILAVAPWEKLEKVIQSMKPLLEEDSGVMFISDTYVLRAEYYQN
jgi:nitrogen regulatory protein PII